MLHLLTVHLVHLRHLLGARRRRDDTGAMNTLEVVVLVVGTLAIASLFVASVREAVTGRLDQLR